MRDRRPIRSPCSHPSRVLRTTAWRAAEGVKPSSCSEPISASCHTPSGRGSRNSPSTVRRVERAAGAPTDRRRRTSFTKRNLVVAAVGSRPRFRRVVQRQSQLPSKEKQEYLAAETITVWEGVRRLCSPIGPFLDAPPDD